MKTQICFLTFCFFLRCTVPAWATIYYVAKAGDGGSDSNTCTQAQTRSTPKLTIGAGIDCLDAGGGDTLYIRRGTYVERLYAADGIPTRTSWATLPTIAGDPGDPAKSAIIRPTGSRVIQIFSGKNYIWFDNLDLDGTNVTHYVVDLDGVNVAGSGFIRISNSDIHGSPSSGVIIGRSSNNNEFLNNRIFTNGVSPVTNNCCGYGFYIQSDDNIVEGNEIYDHTGYGVHVYSSAGVGDLTADRNRIRRNFVHDNCTALVGGDPDSGTDASQSAGILIGSGTDNRAEYNIETGCPFGIMIGQPDTVNNKAYHNTVYGATTVHGARIAGVLVRSGTTGTVVQNNLLYNNVYTINSGVRVDGGTITNTSNSTANPSYINAAGGDFGLQAGSTAIGAGTAIAGYLYNGANPDRGAFQTISCNSAVVPDTASDNLMDITCTNNLRPPALPATTCAGFTVRKNGANNPVTNCVRFADNVFRLTLTNGYSSSDTADFSYTTGSGNISDSAKIGGTKNQRLNAITEVAATNQAGGISAPELLQLSYRFRSYGGEEETPDRLKPVNTPVTVPPGKCTAVIGQLSNTVADFGATSVTIYAQKNGAGDVFAVPDGPCLAGSLCFPPGTGTPPPELMPGPTTAKLTESGFIPGGVQLSAAEVPNLVFTVGDITELADALCLSATANDPGDYFDLYWRQAGGVALTSYAQVPRIVVGGFSAQRGSL